MELLTSLATKKILSDADFAAVKTALRTNDYDEMHAVVLLVEKHQLADALQKELLEVVLDRDRTDDVRRFGCRALAAGRNTLSAFRQIISREELFLKETGYSVLATANFGLQEKLHVLVTGLSEENDDLHWIILDALEEMGDRAVKYLQDILEKESSSLKVKLNCCIALNSVGRNSKKVNAIVARGLKDSSKSIRHKALFATERSAIGDEILDSVGSMINDEDLGLRKTAARCLAKAGPKAAKYADVLAENLASKDRDLQVYSADALVKIRAFSDSVSMRFTSLLDGDEELKLLALRYFEGSGIIPNRAWGKIERLIDDSLPEVAQLASKIVKKARKAERM